MGMKKLLECCPVKGPRHVEQHELVRPTTQADSAVKCDHVVSTDSAIAHRVEEQELARPRAEADRSHGAGKSNLEETFDTTDGRSSSLEQESCAEADLCPEAAKSPAVTPPESPRGASASAMATGSSAEGRSSPTVMEGPEEVPVTDAEAARAYRVRLEAVRALKAQFPESPPAECARFLARNSAEGCPKKAAPLLRSYLEWRTKELARFPPPPQNLPMHVRMEGKAKDGSQLLHFLCCTIDPAFTPEVHGQAMLLWLDKVLPRESTTRLTVLFDVRGHAGIAKNRNIFDIWRHAFALPKLFQTYCPERVEKVIIYPVDEVARTAWSFIRHLVAPSTAKRVVFLPGSSKLGAPSPPELLEYFDSQEISQESRPFFVGLPARQTLPQRL